MITAEQLMAIVPRLSEEKAQEVATALAPAMEWAEIDTPLRTAHFLAQIAHETGGFKWARELGKDSYFERYEGRADLGNTEPGDGPRFRGRGYIQITGRYNYARAGEALGIDLIGNPEQAEAPEIAAKIAAWYWWTRDLNKYADADEIRTITRQINGGLNGLADRQAYYDRASAVLGIME